MAAERADAIAGKSEMYPHYALSEGETSFAIGAGVPADVLDDSGTAWTQPELSTAVEGGAKLTTSAVAALLQCDVSSVRRMKSFGHLLADGKIGRELAFPVWQFDTAGLLPGLHRALMAFPRGFHPRDIERVMATQSEDLDGLSPCEWLSIGRDPDIVAEWIDELGIS